MPPLFRIALLAFAALAANAHAVGQMPTPIFKNAEIAAEASYDRDTGRYVYAYTLTNPAGNTGELWMFKIDVHADAATNAMVTKTSGLTIPMGARTLDFSERLARNAKLNAMVSTPTRLRTETIVPFGQDVPPGWAGGLAMDSTASFSRGGKGQSVMPGASMGGFRMVSFGVPTLREVVLMPWWMHIVEDHEKVTPEEMQAAGKLEQDIVIITVTLGPSGVAHGSPAHWNQLRDDLTRAVKLGWIVDQGLGQNLTAQLASARQAFDARDLPAARSRLQTLLATIARSIPGQATREGFGLVSLNAQSLLDNAK
jgi:hypothetical protein